MMIFIKLMIDNRIHSDFNSACLKPKLKVTVIIGCISFIRKTRKLFFQGHLVIASVKAFSSIQRISSSLLRW